MYVYVGSYIPTGAFSGTAPPGGDSAPSPGVGFGDRASEREPAPSRAGLRDKGEGSPAEGQMPGGAGIQTITACVCQENISVITSPGFLFVCLFHFSHRC